MHHLFDLSDNTALITGLTPGIGFTLAEGLASAGAKVVLNGRSGERPAAAVAKIPRSKLLSFDVTDVEAVRAALNKFDAREAPIDILVNNAGMQLRGPPKDYDPSEFDRLMHTNVNSTFSVGQAVARHMIRQGQARLPTSLPSRHSSPGQVLRPTQPVGSHWQSCQGEGARLGAAWLACVRLRLGS